MKASHNRGAKTVDNLPKSATDLKSNLKGVVAFCLVLGVGVVSTDDVFALFPGVNEYCSAIRNGALNDADRELRDRKEDCDGDNRCRAEAEGWYKDRVDEIWDEFYWCVEIRGGGGPSW